MTYFALVIKVVPDEKCTNRHPQFLVSPFDALGPSVSFTEDTLEDFAEFHPLLLVIVD